MIKAFQTRRLRARGDIGEKALTEKDMEILKNIGLYFNVPAQDDNDTEEGAADLDGNIMRQMRIHVEGDKSTFVEEVAESLDNDQDIYQHDGQDIYQYFDEEPGGCYNIIRSDKSDDHSSSSSSRLVNENKNLIEKVHRLEEELRECIEEREIWKLKATKLQEDLIGKLMSYEY